MGKDCAITIKAADFNAFVNSEVSIIYESSKITTQTTTKSDYDIDKGVKERNTNFRSISLDTKTFFPSEC